MVYMYICYDGVERVIILIVHVVSCKSHFAIMVLLTQSSITIIQFTGDNYIVMYNSDLVNPLAHC